MAELTTDTYTVRFATESDVDTILALIRELAAYEKSADSVQATPESLLATLTFPSDPARGFAKTLLVAPADAPADVAGMAMYFFNYSTWTSAPGVYLEDLYVREAHRKRGYGKALLQALAREAVACGCKRLDWSVLKWNRPSIDFYESEVVGATMMSEWVGMRVDGEKLVKLAGKQ